MNKTKISDMVEKVTSSLKASELSINGKYPVYGAQGVLGYLSTYQTVKKSIAIIKDGAGVGRVQIIPPYSSVIGTMQLLIPKHGFDVNYLYFLLSSLKLSESYSGATIPHIYFKDYGKLLVNTHNKEEQEQISLQLNNISELIQKNICEIERFDELIKSRFIEMFGDKEKTNLFSECVIKMTKGPFGSAVKKDLYVPPSPDAYKVYIQINCIQKDETLGDYYISNEYFQNKMKAFEIKGNDYLITCDGTLGKYIRLSDNPRKGIISASLLRIQLNEDRILPEYFETMWDNYLLDVLKGQVRNGCLVHLPSAKVIGNEHIYLPPIKSQKEFSEFVKLIDKSKFVFYSKYFLWLNFTLPSSTIAYSRVVSIFECPNKC